MIFSSVIRLGIMFSIGFYYEILKQELEYIFKCLFIGFCDEFWCYCFFEYLVKVYDEVSLQFEG